MTNLSTRNSHQVANVKSTTVCPTCHPCWLPIKDADWRLDGIETNILRGISSVRHYDHIRNDIRNRCGIVPIVEKLRERRLRCNGYVIRHDENSLAKIGLKAF